MPPSSNHYRLDAKLMENIAKQTNVVLLGNLFTAMVNIAIFWSLLNHTLLVGWGVAITLVSLLRWVVPLLYLSYPDSQSNKTWWALFICCSFLQGLTWGLLGVYASATLPLSSLIILIISMAGMSAGAVASTSSSVYLFISFSAPNLIPMALTLLSQDAVDARASGFLICLFFLLTARQTQTINQILIDNIRTNIELDKSKLRSEKLAQELYQLSTMDALTLVANRRGFDEALEREWQRATRTESRLTLLLIDVDYFKGYNDQLGHPAGDKCLQEIATELSRHARRAGDIIARYGGEEFGLILPDIDREEGLAIANQICNDIEQLKIPHPNSNCSQYITISIGAHCVQPQRFDDSLQLIKYADIALYQAKAEGRNRAVASAQNAH